MASGDWRLFLALPLPPDAASSCAEMLAPIRGRHPEARWIPVEYLHLTLVFIGAVDPSDVPRIIAAADAPVRDMPAFKMEVSGGSGRARRNGDGVAWLTVGRGATEAATLSAESHAALGSWVRPTREGPPGGRPAGERPHVTVARRASVELIADLQALRAERQPSWLADSVVLYRSHLGPPGARYEAVHRWQLAREPG